MAKKTYKQGSRGDVVRLIQRTVGCKTIDGDFGPRTTEAVVAWQRQQGLTADGIVGAKSLARICGITITEAPITTHITRLTGRTVKYIAIHYTAGSTSRAGTAMQTRQVFMQRSASADFVVDDATIVQVSPNLDSYFTWAVGDAKNKYSGGGQLYGQATNRNTVSIEICSTLQRGTTAALPNHDGWQFTPAALALAARLTRYLMALYDIPVERVVRHYDISGKLCPGVPGWNRAPLYTTDGKATGRTGNEWKWDEWKKQLLI